MKPSPFIYFDLDLWFSQEGEQFRVDLQSKLGPAMGTFRLPFAREEIEKVFVAMGHARRAQTVRRGNSPELEATKDFGKKLFKTVFEEVLRKALFESIKDARDQGARLRIRLHMERAPQLAELPWECLFVPDEGFLALSIDTPLVRYFTPRQQVAPLRIAPPLRILVMIACPTDHMPLDADSEWSSLQRAVEPLQRQGLVDLVRLPRGTISALQDELSRRDQNYHVLHFIGHGDFQKEGVLVTEGEDQPSACISGDELAVLLRDHKSLRLVVLNACEGGRATPSDPFVGVAQRLVQAGVPAVIGMQFEISDKAAVEFARRFYRAAAEGYPIDAAVGEARKALFASGSLEWATPALYLRAADTAIFQIFEQALPVRDSSVGKTTLNASNSIPGASFASGWEKWGRLVVISLITAIVAASSVVIVWDKLRKPGMEHQIVDATEEAEITMENRIGKILGARDFAVAKLSGDEFACVAVSEGKSLKDNFVRNTDSVRLAFTEWTSNSLPRKDGVLDRSKVRDFAEEIRRGFDRRAWEIEAVIGKVETIKELAVVRLSTKEWTCIVLLEESDESWSERRDFAVERVTSKIQAAKVPETFKEVLVVPPYLATRLMTPAQPGRFDYRRARREIEFGSLRQELEAWVLELTRKNIHRIN